jgi:hypothetical protein
MQTAELKNMYSTPVYWIPEEKKWKIFPDESNHLAFNIVLRKGTADEKLAFTNFLSKAFAAANKDLQQDGRLISPDPEDGIIPKLADIAAYPSDSIWFMGLDPQQIGLFYQGIRKYQIIHWNNRKLIFTDSPDKIEQDKNLKLQFWQVMKDVFGIK